MRISQRNPDSKFLQVIYKHQCSEVCISLNYDETIKYHFKFGIIVTLILA